ncbi:MAG: hypothetical protein C0407_14070 [Desulfobacca sp.]|nr:hypothetical protein [Desulfobacca sp.]
MILRFIIMFRGATPLGGAWRLRIPGFWIFNFHAFHWNPGILFPASWCLLEAGGLSNEKAPGFLMRLFSCDRHLVQNKKIYEMLSIFLTFTFFLRKKY